MEVNVFRFSKHPVGLRHCTNQYRYLMALPAESQRSGPTPVKRSTYVWDYVRTARRKSAMLCAVLFTAFLDF